RRRRALSPVRHDLGHDVRHADAWLPTGGSSQLAVIADQDRLVRGTETRRVDLDIHRHVALLAYQLDDVPDPSGLSVAEVVDLSRSAAFDQHPQGARHVDADRT